MYNDRAAAQLAADMLSKGIEAHNPLTTHEHGRSQPSSKSSKFPSRAGPAELQKTLDIEDTIIRKERQDLKLENSELKLQGDRLRKELKTFSIKVDPNEELRGENKRLGDLLVDYRRMLREVKNRGVMRYEGRQAGGVDNGKTEEEEEE